MDYLVLMSDCFLYKLYLSQYKQRRLSYKCWLDIVQYLSLQDLDGYIWSATHNKGKSECRSCELHPNENIIFMTNLRPHFVIFTIGSYIFMGQLGTIDSLFNQSILIYKLCILERDIRQAVKYTRRSRQIILLIMLCFLSYIMYVYHVSTLS